MKGLTETEWEFRVCRFWEFQSVKTISVNKKGRRLSRINRVAKKDEEHLLDVMFEGDSYLLRIWKGIVDWMQQKSCRSRKIIHDWKCFPTWEPRDSMMCSAVTSRLWVSDSRQAQNSSKRVSRERDRRPCGGIDQKALNKRERSCPKDV